MAGGDERVPLTPCPESCRLGGNGWAELGSTVDLRGVRAGAPRARTAVQGVVASGGSLAGLQRSVGGFVRPAGQGRVGAAGGGLTCSAS